jgi:hypothetical protein
MNRREILLGAGALAAATALPAAAQAIKPTTYAWYSSWSTGIMHHETHDTAYTVDWALGTLQSPRAEIVKTWVRETLKSGYILCYGDIRWMNPKVRLESVHIRIDLDDKVFNHKTGYVTEPGLKITVNEDGAKFAPFGLASTHGLSYVREDMRDTYYVRMPYLRYEEERDIRIALGDNPQGYHSPNSKVGFDDSWLKDFEKREVLT